ALIRVRSGCEGARQVRWARLAGCVFWLTAALVGCSLAISGIFEYPGHGHDAVAIMRLPEKSRKHKQGTKKSRRRYHPPVERGLGPAGGGWNIAQAAEWSGLSEIHLRELIRQKEAGKEISVFPYHRAGRRIIIPREGFKAWFNARERSSVE